MRKCRDSFWKSLVSQHTQKIRKVIEQVDWITDKKVLPHVEKGLGRMVERISLPSFVLYLHSLNTDNKLEGSTPKERYKFFVETYCNQFLSDFPELEKIVHRYLSGAVENIQTGIKQLDFHKQRIFSGLKIDGRRRLHRIIIPDNGDRHLGGKQVLFFEFSNGRRIKYKPVNLQVNEIIERVAGLLNSKLKTNIFSFPSGVYLDDCTFLEYKRSHLKINEPKKAEALYYQNGGWLAFVYALNGTDFHVENILSQGPQLYLLDTETLFSNFSYGSGRFVENTLTTTGFIERITKNQPAMSAMFGGREVYKSITDPKVVNDKTDNMKIEFVTTSNFTAENQPQINGSHPDFKANKKVVKQGFRDVYNVVNENKASIQNIVENGEDIRVRQILRKTSLYSLIIQNIYQPQNWPLSEFKQEIQNFLGGLNDDIEKIIHKEVHDLFNFDVPYFTTRLKRKTLHHGDEEIKNFFSETPLERWQEKLSRMGEKHRKQKTEELDRLLSQDIPH